MIQQDSSELNEIQDWSSNIEINSTKLVINSKKGKEVQISPIQYNVIYNKVFITITSEFKLFQAELFSSNRI